MSMLSKPKAIFFDWDGTLVDSFAFLHAAHNHTRAQFGMGQFTLEEFSGYFGQPREKLYTEIYGVENIETAKGHFETFVFANHIEGLKPMVGAPALIEGLSGTDVLCGVVTNKKRELVEAEIKNYGWDEVFVSVVGAGEAEADKPSAAPFLLALERAGLSGSDLNDVWFVGDTDNDLACANEAGAPAVLVTNGDDVTDLLAEYNVALCLENCAELLEYLLQYGAEPLKQREQ